MTKQFDSALPKMGNGYSVWCLSGVGEGEKHKV